MNIQELGNSISELRVICANYELTKYYNTFDSITAFLEAQTPIISIAGARTSGKCALANALVGSDILPSQIFKPHVLYRIHQGHGMPKLQSVSGQEISLHSIEEVCRYSKRDYDSTVILEANTGLFQKDKVEVRTGFENDEYCKLVDSLLSDIIIFCVKATSLFSIEDTIFIDDLNRHAHNKVIVCITHLNDIKSSSIPEIIKFIDSKHIAYPIVFFADEPISDIHPSIIGKFGIAPILQAIENFTSEGINYDLRVSIARTMIKDTIEEITSDLSSQKEKLEQMKEKKYSIYLSKISQRESLLLGWTDVRIDYEKREAKFTETILSELKKAKGKVGLRLQTAVETIPSPKDWWEKVFPLTLKSEIDNITSGIDNMIQGALVRDFNWLNHELQTRFHQVSSNRNLSIGETSLDFSFDTKSLSFKNLRTARYISMAGGAALATTLFFVVGPVGGIASATCSILGERYISKEINEQRSSLKVAVSNVIDDIFIKMESMIPDRVRCLYEEIGREIAEKEDAWSKANEAEPFSCNEITAIKNLSESIAKIEHLK